MRAKLVYEDINFQRGQDPKTAMNIGKAAFDDIHTSVGNTEMQISPRDLNAYLYFDSDGWDDEDSAISQIEGFVEGTHDLIDFGEIEKELRKHGYEMAEGNWVQSGFDVDIPIKPMGQK